MSHMTRTPLSRSKGQRSTLQGWGHIVAASRTACYRWHICNKLREAAQYAPAPVRRTLQPSSSPYTPYASGAQRALLHEYS